MVNRRYRHYVRRGRDTGQDKARRKNFRPALFFLIITLLMFWGIDWCVRPSMQESMCYQAKSIAAHLLSEKTLEVLDDERITYGELCTVARDSEGKIVSIETDMNTVNRVKSRLELAVTEAVQQLGTQCYSVPLGTILGSDFLAGRGPGVELRVVPTGYLQSEFVNVFTSAGINQTNHQIVLKLTLDLTTIVPLHSAVTTLSTNFIVAETVIVGEVPEYYTNIISSDRNLVSDWSDHSPDPLELP